MTFGKIIFDDYNHLLVVFLLCILIYIFSIIVDLPSYPFNKEYREKIKEERNEKILGYIFIGILLLFFFGGCFLCLK